VHPTDPAFIDGQTQEYTAANDAIVVSVRAGRGRFFGFYLDNRQDVGALLQAQEQMFFNAVASPRVSETNKSENHVLCWEGMAIIVWNSKGVLYVDFLTEHHTINLNITQHFPKTQ
jgi:hypothetical protein